MKNIGNGKTKYNLNTWAIVDKPITSSFQTLIFKKPYSTPVLDIWGQKAKPEEVALIMEVRIQTPCIQCNTIQPWNGFTATKQNRKATRQR